MSDDSQFLLWIDAHSASCSCLEGFDKLNWMTVPFTGSSFNVKYKNKKKDSHVSRQDYESSNYYFKYTCLSLFCVIEFNLLVRPGNFDITWILVHFQSHFAATSDIEQSMNVLNFYLKIIFVVKKNMVMTCFVFSCFPLEAHRDWKGDFTLLAILGQRELHSQRFGSGAR